MRGNADHSSEEGDPGDLEALGLYMSEIESLPTEERRDTYRKCAKFILIRYLIERELVAGPLDEEECRPAREELEAENADGICFLFYVRGSIWDVILSRQDACKRAIEKDPDRLADPELLTMDLKKAAKINLRAQSPKAN